MGKHDERKDPFHGMGEFKASLGYVGSVSKNNIFACSTLLETDKMTFVEFNRCVDCIT